jgi:thiol-disulfide isomerase/thioredoxin
MTRRYFLIISLSLILLAAPVITGQEQTSTTLKVGDSRPELNFKLQSGRPGPTWSDLEGKVVVFDFWASWCAPCIAAIPKLNDLEQKFRGKPVKFYSITYEAPAKVAELLKTHPLRTIVGFDNDLATFKAFRSWGIPAVYIFDRKGSVVAAILAEDLTEAVIDEALAGRIPKVEQTMGWKDPAGAEKYFRETIYTNTPAKTSPQERRVRE